MPSAAEQVPGIVFSSEVIPARAGWSRELSRGQVLRIRKGSKKYMPGLQ